MGGHMLTIDRPAERVNGAIGATTRFSPRKRRLHHIFAPDGRAVVVAMDGARNGPARGLEDAYEAVAKVAAGGADAILTSPGMAQECADALGGRGLIVGLDAEDDSADYGVEYALRLGADAVELKVFPGNPTETKMGYLRRLAAKCAAWNVPLLAEPIPVSFRETSAHTVENVAKAARAGAEAGADGCVFGRNVVTHPRPDRMVGALVELIHGGATVEAAARTLAVPH